MFWIVAVVRLSKTSSHLLMLKSAHAGTDFAALKLPLARDEFLQFCFFWQYFSASPPSTQLQQ